jgi:hypothetical protein
MNHSMHRLALGTVQFGLAYGVANQTGQVSRGEAKKMLHIAEKSGIDMLDTAIAYGESEACLGEAGIRSFKLITKLPALPSDCEDVEGWVCRQVQDSFSRLSTDSIYGLLLHRPDELFGAYGVALFRALENLKASGKVRKIGVSVYSPTDLDRLIPRYRFDIIQAPFNLVDRRLHTSGWLRRLKSDGIEIHTRSAFLQGLMLMPKSKIPAKFSAWSAIWSRWHEWIARSGNSPLEACLAFPLSFAEVDRVLVGAESVDQLAQIMEAVNVPVMPDLPDLSCEDEKLINPAMWSNL